MNLKKNPYTFFDEFVLRTACFPQNFYLDFATKQQIQKEDLLHLWNQPQCKEALFLASPAFYFLCRDYMKYEAEQSCNKIAYSLIKYLARMCSRATPFGLFAGVTTGKIANATSIVLDNTAAFSRTSRLDMSFVFALLQQLVKQKNVQMQLNYFPNSSLYKIADHYRYIEFSVSGTKRHYSLQGVKSTAHLEKTLLLAKGGKTIEALSQNLVGVNNSPVVTQQYIKTLIEHQILVSEFDVHLTGEDILEHLIKRLENLEGTSVYLKPLKRIAQQFLYLDQQIGNCVRQYNTLFSLLDETGIDYKKQFTVQTDVYLACAENTLSKKHAYTVQNVLGVLNKLNPAQEHPHLSQFKKAFGERYELREVPLTTVLDIETGIGYQQEKSKVGCPTFLKDIELPTQQSSTKEEFSSQPVMQFLTHKLMRTIHEQKNTLSLSDHELAAFPCYWDDLPDTFTTMIEIIGEETEEQLIIKSVGGSSAANLHARFSHGSTCVEQYVKQITATEEALHQDKILVEIIHLPEARTANILKRPKLRKYELPYLAKSTLDTKHQIDIEDLTLSLRQNRLILRSKRLNKEVIPKLTNAYNYSRNALPIYHFLCDLQRQDRRIALGFSWPKKVEDFPFLPRVVYRNCILSKAQWLLKETEIKAFIIVYNDPEKLMTEISQWRKRYRVPQWVEWIEHDNTLPINLENHTLVHLWLSSIKNKAYCKLKEYLLPESNLVKRDQSFFSHEIVLSFKRSARREL